MASRTLLQTAQPGSTVLRIRAADIARLHTILALGAFLSALVLGCAFHYRKIVKNGVAGYPQEWFPSVSATYVRVFSATCLLSIRPVAESGTGTQNVTFSRSSLQSTPVSCLGISPSSDATYIISGPRFALVLLQYYLRRHSASSLPLAVCITGVARTLSCGGWVYVTSNDDHDVHDVLMILYIVCNIPWMFGNIACTPKEHPRRRFRRYALDIPTRIPTNC